MVRIGIKDKLKNLYQFLKEVFGDFNKDNGSLLAAAIAYYVFTSLIPLILLGISVLGFVLGSTDEAQGKIFEYLATYSPALAREGTELLRGVVGAIVEGRGAIGGLGLIALLWTGTQAFVNMHIAVNIAWGTPNDRGFIKTRLLALLLLLTVGVLLLASFGLTTLLNIVKGFNLGIAGYHPQDIPFIWGFFAFIIPVLVTVAMFTLMYKILPTRPVPMSAALISGITAGVLWELTKYAFSWYLGHFAKLSAVYGSLAGMIIVIFWIYYSSVIMILGAEVGADYGEHIGARHRRS